MAVWPSSLPAPDKTGWQAKRQNAVLRTNMDVGTPKQRRRFTATSEYFTLPYLLTVDEFAALESFYNSDLVDGALEFSWPHPRTGATVTARITEPYDYAPVASGLLWKVTVKFEVLP